MYRSPNQVSPSHPNKSITVYGTGIIQMEPQISKATVGIVTENMNLSTAQKENAIIQQRVVQNLLTSGIAKENIQTVEYTIFPQYDYIDNKQVFNGYQVTHMLAIQMDDIPSTGTIVDMAIQSGANRVTNIAFDVINRTEYYQKALQKALKDALQKAYTIANTLQMKLDPTPTKILEIPANNIPMPLTAMAKSNVGFSTNIEAGLLKVEANLEVKFQYLS